MAIGVEQGMTLIAHSSLSAIGWVVGDAPTVVRALLEVLGDWGTLTMPCATPYCASQERQVVQGGARAGAAIRRGLG